MASSNIKLLCLIILCVFGKCYAGVFQQITLKGEYLTPTGTHPGIPYSGTPSDWTAWQDIEEVESEDPFGLPVTLRTYNLWLNDGTDTILLDYDTRMIHSGMHDFGTPFYCIILDGDKMSWENRMDPVSSTTFNVYSQGRKASFLADVLLGPSYQYAFGPDYFAVFSYDTFTYEIGFNLLNTDTMEWSEEDYQLNSILPNGDTNVLIGLGNTMDVYQNGIDIRRSMMYSGGEDTNVWYTEHYWLEIPEPITISFVGLGALGVFLKRNKYFY